MKIDKSKLIEYINKIKDISILVVGDLAIDEMIYGDTERISREAPVLILQHTRTNIILGAASNAAHNASTINNGKVAVIGVVGDDYQAEQLKTALKDANINPEYLVEEKGRKTVTKTRISGSCSQSVTQQIVRIDRQTNTPIKPETENKIIEYLKHAVPNYDAIILSDYHIGVLTDKIIKTTVDLAKKYNKLTIADVQKDMAKYKNVTSMTPNLPDTQKFMGYELNTFEKIQQAGQRIINETNAQSVLITCGADGMVVVNNDNTAEKIPVFNKSKVFDVTGAGDTVTAIYAMGLASGIGSFYSAVIGNIAASIVIKQFGCATTNINEIITTLNRIDI